MDFSSLYFLYDKLTPAGFGFLLGGFCFFLCNFFACLFYDFFTSRLLRRYLFLKKILRSKNKNGKI